MPGVHASQSVYIRRIHESFWSWLFFSCQRAFHTLDLVHQEWCMWSMRSTFTLPSSTILLDFVHCHTWLCSHFCTFYDLVRKGSSHLHMLRKLMTQYGISDNRRVIHHSVEIRSWPFNGLRYGYVFRNTLVKWQLDDLETMPKPSCNNERLRSPLLMHPRLEA